jgi:hypothetical protein
MKIDYNLRLALITFVPLKMIELLRRYDKELSLTVSDVPGYTHTLDTLWQDSGIVNRWQLVIFKIQLCAFTQNHCKIIFIRQQNPNLRFGLCLIYRVPNQYLGTSLCYINL